MPYVVDDVAGDGGRVTAGGSEIGGGAVGDASGLDVGHVGLHTTSRSDCSGETSAGLRYMAKSRPERSLRVSART